ncbi:MAG: hypothetical protein HRU14_09970, partial [Planctomycetes bacterium]|nr:hypothetical protein [Planctomycetota bacterium]
AIIDPVSGQLSDLVCRDMFVPVLEETPPSAAQHNSRIWSAKPPGWLADQSGYGIGPTMSAIWTGTLFELTENPDAEVFATEGIVRLAIQLQAPTPQVAKEFMNNHMFSDALSLGMFLDAQVACIIDSNSATAPGTTDLNAPGLGLPNLPTVTFTNPITVSIAIVAPATGGAPGAGSMAQGHHYRWRLRGIYPDTTFYFAGPLSSTVGAPVQWEGSPRNSLLFGLTVPSTAQSGDILVSGPFMSLSTLWSSVTVGPPFQ